MGAYLACKELRFFYYGGYVGLNCADFCAEEGEFLYIFGKKGAGKTNLCKALAGLERASGSIVLRGRQLVGMKPRERNVCMTFGRASLRPKKSAEENIAYPLLLRGVPELRARETARRAAARFGLHETGRRAADLSALDAVRCELARVFVRDADLYLLDDPLAALEGAERRDLYGALREAARGRCVLYATDDARECAGRTVVLADCKVVGDADVAAHGTNPTHLACAQLAAEQAGKPFARFDAVLRRSESGYALEIDGQTYPAAVPAEDVYSDRHVTAVGTEDADGAQIEKYYFDGASGYNAARLWRTYE